MRADVPVTKQLDSAHEKDGDIINKIDFVRRHQIFHTWNLVFDFYQDRSY